MPRTTALSFFFIGHFDLFPTIHLASFFTASVFTLIRFLSYFPEDNSGASNTLISPSVVFL
jgi:hypothetical protein